MIYQLLPVGLIGGLIVFLISSARQNMADTGLTGGFGFLYQSTGWQLGFTLLAFEPTDPYWYALALGLLNTLVLAAITLVLASILGLIIGSFRGSGNPIATAVAVTYVEIFRNVPLLLQLMLWYKVLTILPAPRDAISILDSVFLTNRGIYSVGLNLTPAADLGLVLAIAFGVVASLYALVSRRFVFAPGQKGRVILAIWVGVALLVLASLLLGRLGDAPLVAVPERVGLNFRGGIRIPPEFLACIIAMTLYGAAYISEIVRAGFNAVDPGLTEAAEALGLSRRAIFFLVRLPVAFRVMLPTLTNQYIWLIKATTLGIAVGFSDLFMVVSSSINQSGRTFELIGIFMLAFLCINFTISKVMNFINARIALKGSQSSGSGRSRAAGMPRIRSLRDLRTAFFSSFGDAFMTVGFGLVAGLAIWFVVDWALLRAAWDSSSNEACRLPGAGACWGVIGARWRLIFFGLYPIEEQWRSMLACIALVVTGIMTCLPMFWTGRRVMTIWITGFATYYVLMRGGILGLPVVEPGNWGGLALTLFIFASVVTVGMPMAIVFALLRRSRLTIAAWLIGLIIDGVRSLPLLSIIYTAAVILPLALPQWLAGDKLYRAIFGFAVFFACYQAEVLRSGLQTLPEGQEEAAKALGLRYWHRTTRVTLPQAFKISLPPTINQLVITLKETSLVVVIGFFEILASGAAAYGAAEWNFAYLEVYVFVGMIYFVLVFSLSRYGAYLERRMSVG